MDNRPGQPAPLLLQISPRLFSFRFLSTVCALACLLVLTDCASPGEPTERKPPVPQAVDDLAAERMGNAVSLTFNLPQQTLDRRPLTQPLTVEIFRDFESGPAGAPGAFAPSTTAPATLLVTIPPAMDSNYVVANRFHYTDELRPDDFTQHPNTVAVYAVRTGASAKSQSPDSNTVSVRIFPLPDPIDDLKVEVTQSGIHLDWTPPTKTPVGPAPPIVSYLIYRAQTPSSAAAQPPAAQNPSPAAAIPLAKIAETQSPGYFDSEIQFGNSYAYSVRSVVQFDGQDLESADSNRIFVLARPTSPPAAPQGLVVVYVPAQGGEPAHLELSWNISVETYLGGYNVYRSEQPGVQGTRLNSDLLPAPAFQDRSAVPGRAYFYSVTAVDRSGNESPASAAVSGIVPAESQPNP